jgi:hypothetical protein
MNNDKTIYQKHFQEGYSSLEYSTTQSKADLNAIVFKAGDYLAKDVTSIGIMLFLVLIIREVRLLVKECKS